MRRDSPPCCAWVGFSVYSHLRLVPCYTARASFNSSVSKPFTTRKKHVTLPRLRLKVEREDACFLLNEQPPLRGGTRLVRLWKREEKLPPAQRTRADQLRVALSGLGPVFVKIGQTLSQRADLIGDEAADALKALQQSNSPFPDAIAYVTIAEDLNHEGRGRFTCMYVYISHTYTYLTSYFNSHHHVFSLSRSSSISSLATCDACRIVNKGHVVGFNLGRSFNSKANNTCLMCTFLCQRAKKRH